MEVIRKLLSPDELQDPNLRYNTETDTVQITNDGGSSWLDSPGQDPRKINSYPAPTGDSASCDAAARMVALIKAMETETENQLANGAAFTAFAAALNAILLFIPGIDIISTLLLTLCAEFIAAGYAAVHAGFLGFDWTPLECELFTQIDPSSHQIDQAGVDLVTGWVSATYSTVVALVINGEIQATGFGGLNDAAATRTETGDCSTCTWSKTFDFTIGAHTFAVCSGCAGSYVASTGFPNNSSDCGGYYRSCGEIAFICPVGCEVTGFSLVFTGSQTYGRVIGIQNHDGTGFQGIADYSNTPATSPLTDTISFFGTGALAELSWTMDDPTQNHFTVVSYTVSGTGLEPAFPT